MQQDNVAIVVEEIGKSFVMSASSKFDPIQDKWERILRNPFRTIGKKKELTLVNEESWALRNISFSLNTGETLGIVGPNGSGKSLFLKIISRVTPPSSGKAFVKGKVVALLEVSDSFDPDLSGRENILIGGAIFGMKMSQIKKKFDQIVQLSEIGEYLDIPVKRYSSGMRAKLIFAIALNANPDILILDEVLSVIDKTFQKKCIKLLKTFRENGKTLLIVNHDVKVMEELCTKAIWIHKGQLVRFGGAEEVLNEYINGYQVKEKVE